MRLGHRLTAGFTVGMAKSMFGVEVPVVRPRRILIQFARVPEPHQRQLTAEAMLELAWKKSRKQRTTYRPRKRQFA